MIKSKKEQRNLVIDLTGPDGNAFVLIGYAKKLCQLYNLDFIKVQDEMTSGDYENLVNVFDKYFGEFVILYR